MTVIKYEQLRTLICGVTLEGHFDLKMLVINFCSLGRSFMNIAKYFRYKKWLSREEEKCTPPPPPFKDTEALWNVGFRNVWANSQNHFRHLWRIILKMLHSIYRMFQKKAARKKNWNLFENRPLFMFIWYITLLELITLWYLQWIFRDWYKWDCFIMIG